MNFNTFNHTQVHNRNSDLLCKATQQNSDLQLSLPTTLFSVDHCSFFVIRYFYLTLILLKSGILLMKFLLQLPDFLWCCLSCQLSLFFSSHKHTQLFFCLPNSSLQRQEERCLSSIVFPVAFSFRLQLFKGGFFWDHSGPEFKKL